MTAEVPDALRAQVIDALRGAGARFALLHGSRVTGTHQPNSDVDVAAWWAGEAPQVFEVDVPGRGRSARPQRRTARTDWPDRPGRRPALRRRSPARVHWVATTRKIYADEQPRLRRSHRDFVAEVAEWTSIGLG
jgi:hypothetical protein